MLDEVWRVPPLSRKITSLLFRKTLAAVGCTTLGSGEQIRLLGHWTRPEELEKQRSIQQRLTWSSFPWDGGFGRMEFREGLL